MFHIATQRTKIRGEEKRAEYLMFEKRNAPVVVWNGGVSVCSFGCGGAIMKLLNSTRSRIEASRLYQIAD
jgi:hypothetical protein